MMGFHKMYFHKTQFIFLFRKMFLFIRVLWVCFFTLFGFSRKCLFRFLQKFIPQKKNSNSMLIEPKDDHQINRNVMKLESNNDVGEDDKDESESIFRFRFPTYEEFLQNNNGQFLSDTILCENSDDKSSGLEDYVGSEIEATAKSIHESSLVEEVLEHEISSKFECLSIEKNDNSLVESLHVGNVIENDDVMENSGNIEVEMRKMLNDSTNNEDVIRNSDDESLVSDSDSDSDSDSIAPSSVSSFRSSFMDSHSDGILSDIDFEKAFEVDTSKELDWNEVHLSKEALTEEDIELQNLSKGYDADDYDDEDEAILEELKNIELNLDGDDGNLEKANNNNEAENKQSEEKTSSGEQLSSDSDEQNGLESQWEHQDLVEQLKMEIKKVRAIGLPTILEESESPKIMDDLKPWKIKDHKHQYGGTSTMDELHKFYKSYKERMRKLDILNYQKMYAIGFLRLKDPLESFTKNKISTPALSTIVSLDCWPCKPKTVSEIHQPVMKKFSRELESDLEMVYVGQMCLSWEFLRWQYGKALELWESDPHGMYRYNEVADRFQTFQVLLTRFLEDEVFQGPRVQTFVKNRCVHRNLLQVPLIRDDSVRDRRKERKVVSSKDAITSLQLVEIMEESIRILWRFIKADKDTSNNVLLKCRRSSNVELQNPADATLLAEVRSTLQKKEKKLKELLRSENCILRKLQKNQQEDESYFFSQVDMRLISRVLNMSKITTEQLVWCSDKLSHIHLVDRKLQVDSSVLLFPCS
ncbi:Halomucin [Bienertia sinuspersici]